LKHPFSPVFAIYTESDSINTASWDVVKEVAEAFRVRIEMKQI